RERPAKYLLCAVAGGGVFGLGFYTYMAFRSTPLLLLLPLFFFRKEHGAWKCLALFLIVTFLVAQKERQTLFLIVTFLVALPIGCYYLRHPADFLTRTAQVSVTKSANPLAVLARNAYKTALMFNWHGDRNWRHNISRGPQLFWPVGIFFILGMI